ncbi:hypothetical protein TNCV_2405171 [Trichonephila clavipes]|nr:hypothetical protein TNCV_2405171 [Trichonephila clavipes]
MQYDQGKPHVNLYRSGLQAWKSSDYCFGLNLNSWFRDETPCLVSHELSEVWTRSSNARRNDLIGSKVIYFDKSWNVVLTDVVESFPKPIKPRGAILLEDSIVSHFNEFHGEKKSSEIAVFCDNEESFV